MFIHRFRLWLTVSSRETPLSVMSESCCLGSLVRNWGRTSTEGSGGAGSESDKLDSRLDPVRYELDQSPR